MKIIYSGIYRIRNTITNKSYYGSSEDLEYRKNKHFKLLELNNHGNIKLQNSYNKHGKENFVFEIVEIILNSPLKLREDIEQKYLDFLRPYSKDYDIWLEKYGKEEADKRQEEMCQKMKNNHMDFNGINSPRYGKYGAANNKKWINNGIKEIYVIPEEISKYEKLGFKKGRLKIKCCNKMTGTTNLQRHINKNH